jgi:hypothetical protein
MTTLLLAAFFVAVFYAPQIVLWARPRFQIKAMQQDGRRMRVHATRIRCGRRSTLQATGCVTTWRDEAGHEIRDRETIEYLYAVWLRHGRSASS